MLTELHRKGGTFCEAARSGLTRCPLLIRSTSEDVITGELIQVLRALNPRWWLPDLLNSALGYERFSKQIYRNLRIEPWVNQPPYPKELLPWVEGSTQVDIEISWENPPTTVFIEAKYQSELGRSTSHGGNQLEYPTDQLIRNVRVGLHRCGYFEAESLFKSSPRDFAVILLSPEPNSNLVKEYRQESLLRKAIPHSDRLKTMPRSPFVGQIGYAQINQLLRRRTRFFNRAERELARHLMTYLEFKKETMRKKSPILGDISQVNHGTLNYGSPSAPG